MTNHSTSPGSVSEPRRRNPRMKAEDRERLIVQGAVQYFSEVGLEGDTRELASRLGVTHSLLFKYFPNKEALVERVYQEVLLGRWNPYWEVVIEDRSIALRERLVRFYTDYSSSLLRGSEWIRIFLFAGLKGSTINRRFMNLIRDRAFFPLCKELRHELALPTHEDLPITDFELELFVGNSSRLAHMAIRKWVYGIDISPTQVELLVKATVDIFLNGVEPVLRAHFQLPPTTHASRLIATAHLDSNSQLSTQQLARTPAPRKSRSALEGSRK